jgi:hypothetical protein
MQRRLSIAMALISDPANTGFLTSLRSVGCSRTTGSLVYYQQAKRQNHDHSHNTYTGEAEALADRIGDISKGSLKAIGTAKELIAKNRR